MAASAELAVLISARDQASRVLDGVRGPASNLGSQLKTLALAAGAAAGAFIGFKAIESAINQTQEMGLAVAKLSRETGLSSEASSRLLFALHHVGLGADDGSRALGIFAKKLKGISDEETGVTKGGKSMAQILGDIGVQALDAHGAILPITSILPQLADRFKAMPDGLEKTGLAMQLFGRSGKDMIPLLNQGSEGLAALAKEADKLGLTLTGKNVADIKAFTFAHRDMEAAISGLRLQIGLYFMPLLTRFAQWFTEHQPEIRVFIALALNRLSEAIDDLRQHWAAIQPTLAVVFSALREGFDTAVKPLLEFIINNRPAAVAALLAIGVAAILAFTPITLPILGVILALAGLLIAIGLVRQNFDELKAFLRQNWQDILSTAIAIMLPPFGLVAIFVSNSYGIRDKMLDAFSSIPGRLLGLLGGFLGAGRALGGGILDGLRDGLSGALGFAQDIGEAVVATLRRLVNRDIVDRINEAIPPSLGWGPLSIDLPDNPIPRLQAGLPFVPRDMLAFLHRGEMVVPQPLAGGLRAQPAMAIAGGGDVNIYFSGPFLGDEMQARQFARMIGRHLEREGGRR